MNEGDFDKIISKKLKEEGADYPNLDANWQKVKDKMALLQETKPSAGGLLVLPNSDKHFWQKKEVVPALMGALLLLLGVNGWLLWHIAETKAANKPLIENQNTRQTIRLYDTIVETKVIYKIDTVYQKVILKQPVLAQFADNADFTEIKGTPSVFSSLSIPYDNVKDRLLEDLKTINKEVNSAASSVSKPQTQTTLPTVSEAQIQIKDWVTSSIQQTPLVLDSSQTLHNAEKLDAQINNQKEDTLRLAKAPFDSLEWKPSEIIQKIIKKGAKKTIIDHYAAGVQIGASWLIPKPSGVGVSDLYGLTGEIAFKKRLSLSFSLDNANYHFKTNTREALFNLPANPPLTENYYLKYVEATISSLQAGLGLSYQFLTEKKLKPFLSMGYQHRWALPYSAEIEFINKLTGEEKSYQINSTQYHQDNLWYLGLGVETKLSKRFFVRLKGDYIIDPNHGLKPYHHFLLRGGFFYKF